jgi:hypothetical protein
MFETSRASLIDFIADLTKEKIQMEFYSRTYYRGLKYYQEDRVEDVSLQGNSMLTARVQGARKYDVSLELQGTKIIEKCSCPIGSSCKHIVALLLYCEEQRMILDGPDALPKELDVEIVTKHLNSRSKKELVRLVLKYAPDDFLETITKSTFDPDQSRKVFERITSKIEKLFDDDELMYEPGEFEALMVAQLKKLRGVWRKLPIETGDLFLGLMDKINGLMDEGLLYNNYYDAIFEGDEFCKEGRAYARSLPFQDRVEYLTRLEEKIADMDYDSFNQILRNKTDLFSSDELPGLKAYFIQTYDSKNVRDTEDYYQLLENQLNPKEKESILKKTFLASKYLTEQLATLYLDRDRPEQAIQVIEGYLEESALYFDDSESLYLTLLDLKKQTGSPLEQTALAALNKRPTLKLLDKAIAYLPEKREDFEQIVRKKNAPKFLEYLESNDRAEEALNLVEQSDQIWEEGKFHFYVRHRKEFPTQAASYFIRRINEELPYTGDEHYYKIAENLKALKKVERNNAIELANKIRIDFKRRRNLMKAIDGI